MSLQLTIDPRLLNSFIGGHQVQITLTDKVGTVRVLKFRLFVLEISKKKDNFHFVFKQPPPRPFIANHNHFGKLKVGFTRPLVLPTYGRYPEFTEDEYFMKNCTNGEDCQPWQYRHLQDMEIGLEQEMKEAIEIINHGLVWENNTY